MDLHREWTGDAKIKKIGEFEIRKSCSTLIVNTNDFTNSYNFLYVVCRGKWEKISRKLYYDGMKSELS